jgi:4-amino-4-deoxy-L-arabinose transferase-like glycosyltransferase
MQPTQEGNAACHDCGAGRPIGHRDRLVLLLIFLIGAAVRLFRLDAQSVWYDEAFSVAHAVRPLAELIKILVFDVVHPPLHYLVLHEWFQIAGFGTMQARLVSAILGTLSIPLLFLLARRFTDSATSLVAAFLLAISQVGVYFSQEARPYAQAQFLSLLAALAFFWFLEKPSFRRSMCFTAAGTALLYTHYYGAGTLLALGVYWLIFRRYYSPLVLRWLATIVVLLAVTYVPWILALESGGRLNQQRLIKTGAPSSERPNLFSPIRALNRFNNAKFESIEAPTSLPEALLGLTMFTLPAAGALWYTWRRGPQGAVLGYLLAAIPVGMAIVFGAFGVIFNYRHFSFAVPGYYLAVAIGWRVCFRHIATRSTWLAIVVVLSGFALRANHVVTKPDYRGGFLPLAESYHPGDCVTACPRTWNSKVHLAWEVYYRDRGTLRLVPFDSLATASMTCERLWVVWDRTWWMNRDQEAAKKSLEAIAMLGKHYTVVKRYDHPAVRLQLLERQPGGEIQ